MQSVYKFKFFIIFLFLIYSPSNYRMICVLVAQTVSGSLFLNEDLLSFFSVFVVKKK